MRREIVVTDLTRFRRADIVCSAGIDLATGECIRPMPYLESARCLAAGFVPGSRLRGEFSPTPGRTAPHTEDHDYGPGRLGLATPACRSVFREALLAGSCPSVREGFGHAFGADDRCVPLTVPAPPRSLITIVPDRRSVRIEPSLEPGRVRLHFRDATGQEYRYVPLPTCASTTWRWSTSRRGRSPS